ncbi:MAG: ABC transporter permease subunit [Oscillospiraceae bacterium]
MRSVTSFFNPTLFRKNLSRFWPLWALYGTIWLFMMPVAQFVQLHNRYSPYTRLDIQRDVLGMGLGGGLTLALFAGVLLAMALFSYLCTARSVGLMHTLPIRREAVFCTNYLSGLFMLFSTHGIIFLLTVAVEASGGVGIVWKELLLWLLLTCGFSLFFFSMATFCAMFAGQVLAIAAFYAIFNVLAVGVDALVRSFAGMFLYGSANGGLSDWVTWLSPVVRMVDSMQVQDIYNSTVFQGNTIGYTVTGLSTLLIYMVVALVLTALAFLVYRSRRSESAGDTVAISWAKPLFRYGVTFCTALSLGQGLYVLLWQQFQPSWKASLPGMLFCMLLTGLVGYYGAEMLLRKSFRVLKGSLKNVAAVTVAIALLGCAMAFDITGFQRRVPTADSIESVNFYADNNIRGDLTDADSAQLELVLALHQAAVENKDATLAAQQEMSANEAWNTTSFSVNYFLKNGSSLRRYYTLCPAEVDRAVDGSVTAALLALVGDPTLQKNSLLYADQIERISSGDVNFKNTAVSMDTATAEEIYAALLRDAEKGRLAPNLFVQWTEDGYWNAIHFYYLGKEFGDNPLSVEKRMNGFDVTINPRCTETLAALKKAGIVTEESPLTTMTEWSRENDGSGYGENSYADTPIEAIPEEPVTTTAVVG